MRVLVLLSLCALFASSIEADITIEVVLPVSESSGTQIYIDGPGEEGGVVSVYHNTESSSDPEDAYVYDEVIITANDLEGGAASQDDLVVGIEHTQSADSEVVAAGYATAEGEWGLVGAGQTTTVIDANTTETVKYAEVSTGEVDQVTECIDDDGNVYACEEEVVTVDQDDYIIQDTVTNVEDGVYTETTVEVGSFEGVTWVSQSETVATGDETGGSGVTEEEFTWVVTQQVSEEQGGVSPVVWIMVATAIAIVGLFLYRKVKQAKFYRINNTVRAVDEESLGYIRI